jgi:hypothetical protein
MSSTIYETMSSTFIYETMSSTTIYETKSRGVSVLTLTLSVVLGLTIKKLK